MSTVVRGLILAAGLCALWQGVVMVTAVPSYILPGPWMTVQALVDTPRVYAVAALVTLSEIVLGLLVAVVLGTLSALVMALSPMVYRWSLPVLVISQALPVFALAPILVLWLGFGMASKIAMAALIIYFPVTAALSHGLRNTPLVWLEMASVMNARPGATLRYLRLPAALPAFASGLKIAAATAPIGAIVGEWVGSGAGLGFLMLDANARVQTDRMFAALLLIAVMAVALYSLIDRLTQRWVFWSSHLS